MKGKLLKTDIGWNVQLNDQSILPLNPYDVQMIEDQKQVFDNIEARIAAYPDVEIAIELFWETGIEEPFYVATIITEE